MPIPRKPKKQKSPGRCYGCCSARRLRSRLTQFVCVQCRTQNACGVHGHTHLAIGDRARVPRRRASDVVWRRFLKRFAPGLAATT